MLVSENLMSAGNGRKNHIGVKMGWEREKITKYRFLFPIFSVLFFVRLKFEFLLGRKIRLFAFNGKYKRDCVPIENFELPSRIFDFILPERNFFPKRIFKRR